MFARHTPAGGTVGFGREPMKTRWGSKSRTAGPESIPPTYRMSLNTSTHLGPMERQPALAWRLPRHWWRLNRGTIDLENAPSTGTVARIILQAA